MTVKTATSIETRCAEKGMRMTEQRRTIARVLKEENANLLVLGYAPGGRYRMLIGRSLVDQILSRVQNVDIYLVEKRQ